MTAVKETASCSVVVFSVLLLLLEGPSRVYTIGAFLEVGETEISVSVVPKGLDSASICGLVIGAATVSGVE